MVTSNPSEKHDFTAHLTRFCRVLRGYGFLIGPQETADVIKALSAVDIMDRGRVYWTLRCLLVSRQDEFPAYDMLFEKFWNFEPIPTRGPATPGAKKLDEAMILQRRPKSLFGVGNDQRSDEIAIQEDRIGAGDLEVDSEKDLTMIRADEFSELSRIAARMVRALASRPGRRRKRHKRKGVPDLRGAMRLNLSTGGDLIVVPRRRRVPRVPRLLVLLDVSGSMERHVQLLLQLAYAVSQQTRRVEAFVFSTRVTRVTRELAMPSFAEALSRIGEVASHWSGGTRIGEALATVNTDFGYVLDRHTTVFLLSDGWDTGDPGYLASQIRRMRRRVRSFVWLNPLMGTRDYQPLTRSLQAAEPYVDHFASALDVAHLRRLPQLLRS
ncbi:MAG: VWA domain-containing protein [Chloroflexi bacterium]|nr:VWA domain-containing protein [Chloroflexota bacterium]MCI0813128.1 VWA domain-containing protein [Chloroflexota bacterium]MCI0870120.1 VWA domain-containing protein [Chloroflexota bacterium]